MLLTICIVNCFDRNDLLVESFARDTSCASRTAEFQRVAEERHLHSQAHHFLRVRAADFRASKLGYKAATGRR